MSADDSTLDMARQSRRMLEKLDELRGCAGSSKKGLFSAQIRIFGMAGKVDMNCVWGDGLDSGDLPIRATTYMADLGPETLIEVLVTTATELN